MHLHTSYKEYLKSEEIREIVKVLPDLNEEVGRKFAFFLLQGGRMDWKDREELVKIATTYTCFKGMNLKDADHVLPQVKKEITDICLRYSDIEL